MSALLNVLSKLRASDGLMIRPGPDLFMRRGAALGTLGTPAACR